MTEVVDLGRRMKPHFSRSLLAAPGRLHAAAHSHHPWPDVSFAAHQRAWLDAAAFADHKWEHVADGVWTDLRGWVARRVGLSDPATVAVAPNTHELVARLLSCLDPGARVLTTDAEFHSFDRQVRRLEEERLVEVERVAAEPFTSLPDRFVAAAERGGHDLVFLSRVLFDSGYVVEDVGVLIAAVPDERTLVVVDDYHGFMALPVDWALLESRAFYLAGGYKYAMAGEGACFAHCPPGYARRPRHTGWFAAFDALEDASTHAPVHYPDDGRRLLGSTFDPSGMYRFVAVQSWLEEHEVTVADIHTHVARLQQRFLHTTADLPELDAAQLLPPDGSGERGNFLTFRLDRAGAIVAALAEQQVIVDHRGDRLRIGFGLYHDEDDVDELVRRLTVALGSRR